METRTDLALEQASALPAGEGLQMQHRGNAFAVTEICITDDAQGAAIGRTRGRYLTLESERLSAHSAAYREQAEELAAELRTFLPDGEILVVGLGNQDITPDALGPAVAGKVLATRHLREALQAEEPDAAFLRGLRPVSVLANGVLGQTGIETAELIHALKDTVQPCGVVAVDALACSDLSRLGTTIQISDAGISPGSGVQNRRQELSAQTLGVPVVAIGVPMVVDMHTIARKLFGDADPPVPQPLPNMMVTPRDVDQLLLHAARLIACALNLALHPQFAFEDVEALG